MSELDRARGGYVGPVTREQALDAIRAHYTGPVIVEYPARGFAGGETKVASGYQSEAGLRADAPDTEVFVFSERHGVPLSVGVLYESATVLDLSDDGWSAEMWTGGLDIRMGRSLVRLAFWHAVQHATEDGDLAPGFGPMEVGFERMDSDDD